MKIIMYTAITLKVEKAMSYNNRLKNSQIRTVTINVDEKPRYHLFFEAPFGKKVFFDRFNDFFEANNEDTKTLDIIPLFTQKYNTVSLVKIVDLKPKYNIPDGMFNERILAEETD